MLIHRKNSCCKTVSSSTTSGLGGLIISYQYKNTGFIDDLSDVRGVEIDASGYNLAITPASVDSKIRVMFRALVKTSDEAFSRIKFKISYDIGNTGLSWEELCSDINLGYTNRLAFYPDPLTSIYSVDTIHSPNTTQSINYKLSYQIEASGIDVSTSTPIGVLESSANSIILEELNGTGTTGLSTWSIGSGNTIYYNRSSVGIGVNTVDTNYVLDVSGNTRIRGDLEISCNRISDVSSITFCDGTYIGPGASFDISSADILKITSYDFVLNNSFYQVNVSGNKHYYGFNEPNPQRDYVFATDETDTTLALYNTDETGTGGLIISFRNDISGRDLSFIETGSISNTMQDSSHTVFKMYNFRGGVINNFITADGSSNSVSVKGYTDISGKLAINRQTAEAILDIQQAEDADVSGNTNVISRGDAIKIRNLANTSNWIIACDSSVSGSDLFILNENEQGGKIDGNEAPSNRFQDITFTGQHRTIYKNMNIENDIGLIVVSNNQYLNLDNTIEPTVDESLPIVVLASTDNDKQVFGVVSNIENQNYKSRIHNTGRFAAYIQKYTVNERRVLINSVGEGGIWVCNKNGILENGDYITSSSVIGYGVKQQDDILHNYTVAKITCSCDFNLNKIIKKKVNTIIDGDNNRQIVYTTDGDIEYVDDLDSLGNIQMVYKYDTRFLDVSGNIVNEGQHSYIACFVGCTYHCG